MHKKLIYESPVRSYLAIITRAEQPKFADVIKIIAEIICLLVIVERIYNRLS